MLSSAPEEHKTPRLKHTLDIKGYNATVPFLREICEVARLSPSRYGSLHIDLQALLPQLGSDVDLARYASLPVPPVAPVRPTLASLPPRLGPPPHAGPPAGAPVDPPMVPPAGPTVAERYATRSVARAPAADDNGPEPPAAVPPPVVEDRTAELEAAVEHYKDVVLPDYRDAKAAYEKRMVLHRAFDANLYELAIKNVTPAVIERLNRDYYEPYLTASSPASGIALAKLLMSSLKPTPHEKHVAQRDLFSQLEGLKQGKDTPMESHLHSFKTCHQRLLDLDYVLDEGAAIGIFVNGMHSKFRTIFETLRLQESVDTLAIAYSHATRAAEQVRKVSRVPNGRSPTPSGHSTAPSRTVKFAGESKPTSGHFDSRIHCAYCWRTVQRTYRHSESECNRKKDAKGPVQFAGLAVSSTQAHVNYGRVRRTCPPPLWHIVIGWSRSTPWPIVMGSRSPPMAHRHGVPPMAHRHGIPPPPMAHRQGVPVPPMAHRRGVHPHGPRTEPTQL